MNPTDDLKSPRAQSMEARRYLPCWSNAGHPHLFAGRQFRPQEDGTILRVWSCVLCGAEHVEPIEED